MSIQMQPSTVSAARLAGAGTGKQIYVPVRPILSPYAQYKHVRGVPAPSPKKAVPLSKLRVLNNIIDSLQKFKSDRQLYSEPAGPAKEGLSDEAVEAMIKQYSEQLHQAIKQTPPAFATPTSSDTGMAVSISV